MSFLLPTTKISTSQGQTSEFGITSSEYDREIPFGYGADRLPGNIIWANNIQEEKVTTTTKQGGKGSPKTKTTTTTYLYYVDLAVLVCEGVVDAILRVWADGKIIYDPANGTQIDGLDMRVYRGTEDQLPDALIELATGANLAPAYRGLCYVVFERFPLGNFGNRIPAFSFEVAFDGALSGGLTESDISEEFTNNIYSGDGGGTYTASIGDDKEHVRWNYETNELVHGVSGHTGGAYASCRINPTAKTVAGMPSRTEGVFTGQNRIQGIHEPTGNYMTHQSENVGGERKDMFLRARDTAADLYVADSDDSERLIDAVVMDVAGTPIGVGTAMGNGDLTVDGYSATSFATLATCGGISRPSGYDNISVQLGRTTERLSGSGVFAEAFGMWTKTTEIKIVQILATSATSVIMSVIATITPDDVVPGATSWNVDPHFAVNRLNGELYIHHTIDGQPYCWCWSPNTADVEWKTAVPHVHTGWRGTTDGSGALVGTQRFGTAGADNLIGEDWVWVDSNKKVIKLSLTNGAIDPTFDGTQVVSEIAERSVGSTTIGSSVTARSHFHWNDATKTLINAINEADLADSPDGVYFYEISSTADTDMNPRSTIQAVCVRAGLSTSDIDVSAVPTSKDGLRSMVVRERTSAEEAISPLLDLLEIEVVESDFVLKFVPRGTVGSVATIPETDMVPNDENRGEPYLRAFLKEEDLPKRFEVSYTDFDLDYQESVQADERSEVTQFTQSVEGFEYNGTCKSQLPRQSAQVKLYTSWSERERLRQRLPQKYLYLDAGDVVTVTLDNGDELVGRMRRADIGANFNIEVEQVAETTGVYTADIAGAISDGHFTSEIPNTGDSLTVLLDSPLIRDEDDPGATQTNAYWAANGAATWPGVVLFKETGSSTVQEMGQQLFGVPYGVLATAPSDMDKDVYRFVDETFQVTIANGIDEFESVTDADVLAGRNLLAIVHTDGSLELLQFGTVTVISEYVLELGRLLRGRRGTDAMASGHSVGDYVYLLDAAWVDKFSQAVANVGSAQSYRGVTIGQLYEDANSKSFTDTGRDLKPYAPTHISYADDGASGLDISWFRRTRIGGEQDWLLSGDVPLSEASESYEVDILDGPGGSVLRTLSSTSETVNYSNANIVTDFGSLPANLTVIVYQISAVVGRGFGREVTLETA
jgi:hypothetical protein